MTDLRVQKITNAPVKRSNPLTQEQMCGAQIVKGMIIYPLNVQHLLQETMIIDFFVLYVVEIILQTNVKI